MSFTVTVKNRQCGKVTCHCRKAQPYRADLSLFLNVLGVTVKSEMTYFLLYGVILGSLLCFCVFLCVF